MSIDIKTNVVQHIPSRGRPKLFIFLVGGIFFWFKKEFSYTFLVIKKEIFILEKYINFVGEKKKNFDTFIKKLYILGDFPFIRTGMKGKHQEVGKSVEKEKYGEMEIREE